jgi:hypothetical protein
MHDLYRERESGVRRENLFPRSDKFVAIWSRLAAGASGSG